MSSTKHPDNDVQQQSKKEEQTEDTHVLAYFLLRAGVADWSDIAKYCSPELQRKVLKKYLKELMGHPEKSS